MSETHEFQQKRPVHMLDSVKAEALAAGGL